MKKEHLDKETRNTLILGVFVSIGLILLIISVYLIGSKKNLFTSNFHITASFRDVNGLQNGDNVRFRGINIGTVKEMNVLNDSTINVIMICEEKMKIYIKKNAVASIATDGLMGNKMVSLNNGTAISKIIEENDTLQTLQPLDITEIEQKLKYSNDNIASITNNLSNIIDEINKGKGAIGTLVMDTVFAKNMNESMRNLRTSTTNLSKESEALKHNFLFKKYFKNKDQKEK
ncbi:MAG TPA: MlaD family protein [Bacteroidia bacterium]|nr:MlaD family protein [Bacteroidia bacterium]